VFEDQPADGGFSSQRRFESDPSDKLGRPKGAEWSDAQRAPLLIMATWRRRPAPGSHAESYALHIGFALITRST